MIDIIGNRILSFLQSDARTSNADIARQVELTPSAVLERIRKLRSSGVIRGFHASVDREALGWGVTAFIHLQTNASMRSAEVADELASIDTVLEIHDVAGTDCFLIKVVARDITDLHELIHGRIAAIPAVTSSSTTIVLRTFKETGVVPMPEEIS